MHRQGSERDRKRSPEVKSGRKGVGKKRSKRTSPSDWGRAKTNREFRNKRKREYCKGEWEGGKVAWGKQIRQFGKPGKKERGCTEEKPGRKPREKKNNMENRGKWHGQGVGIVKTERIGKRLKRTKKGK